MLRSRVDRAFGRYQKTGDPHALARVFDATAPELYRIAFHLVCDRHAAEDLVQATFVAAIENAASFDGERRVLPWLLGILANRSRHHRRQTRLRDPVRHVAPSSAADPIEVAAAGELNATVTAAVRRLPDPYRQVVLLHLLHELTPREVAEALARPDATVRTQLHRGLDLLRKLLPASLVGMAPGCAPPPLGLGTVRATVLATAARHGGITLGAGLETFGGILLMKKALSLGLAVVMALLVSWFFWPSSQPLPAPEVRGAPAIVAVRAPGVEVPDVTTAPPTVREVATPPAADERTCLAVLVRWSDGTPAPDVTVRCKPVREDGELWLRAARTDTGGNARFDELGPGKVTAAVDRGGKAEVELAPATTTRLTLDIPRGFDVHGRVLDPDDRPIAGATVWLSVAPNSDESEPVATAELDGAFTIRSASASHVLSATALGYGCAHVAFLSESNAGEERIVRLRRAPGVLIGTVVDPSGNPVADARVLVGAWMTDGPDGTASRILGEVTFGTVWPSRFLRTDATGAFRAEGLPPLPWPVWVAAPGFALSHQVADVRADAATQIVVQVQQGAGLDGVVADATGVPVADAQVTVFYVLPTPHREIGLGMPSTPPSWVRWRARTDTRGGYTFEHLMPGKVVIDAWCAKGSARAELELANGQQLEWNPCITVVESLRLLALVVDEQGQPLAGWNVSYESVATGEGMSSIITDSKGMFRSATVTDGDYRISVRAGDPTVGPTVAVGTLRPGPDRIRIVVPRDAIPGGALRGAVLGPDGTPSSGWLEVRNLATGQLTHASFPERGFVGRLAKADAATAPDGHYQSPALTAGRYRVTFSNQTLGSHTLGEVDVPDHGTADLGVFRVPAPGRLEVTTVDTQGHVIAESWLRAHSLDDRQPSGWLTQREGHVHGSLRPGRYLLMTYGELCAAAQELDVRSGETTKVQFVVPEGVPMRLHVPEPARQRHQLRQAWRDAQGRLLRESDVDPDAAGMLVCAAPAGRYTLEVRDEKGRSASTSFDLRATDPPMVIELPLPAK
ncbi:MAG: sigma-70 family RNA polymerase sigma factor [Planctomycetota bacterium]